MISNRLFGVLDLPPLLIDVNKRITSTVLPDDDPNIALAVSGLPHVWQGT